jgi:hypothetical protein
VSRIIPNRLETYSIKPCDTATIEFVTLAIVAANGCHE